MARKLVDFKNFSVYWDTEMLGSVEGAGVVVSVEGAGVVISVEEQE